MRTSTLTTSGIMTAFINELNAARFSEYFGVFFGVVALSLLCLLLDYCCDLLVMHNPTIVNMVVLQQEDRGSLSAGNAYLRSWPRLLLL